MSVRKHKHQLTLVMYLNSVSFSCLRWRWRR